MEMTLSEFTSGSFGNWAASMPVMLVREPRHLSVTTPVLLMVAWISPAGILRTTSVNSRPGSTTRPGSSTMAGSSVTMVMEESEQVSSS